jgi:hypothetical protein
MPPTFSLRRRKSMMWFMLAGEIQLQMPCRPMKSKSGRSDRLQKSAKASSNSLAPVPEAAMSWAKAAWDGLKSVPYHWAVPPAACMLALSPWPKPSSQAAPMAGGA